MTDNHEHQEPVLDSDPAPPPPAGDSGAELPPSPKQKSPKSKTQKLDNEGGKHDKGGKAKTQKVKKPKDVDSDSDQDQDDDDSDKPKKNSAKQSPKGGRQSPKAQTQRVQGRRAPSPASEKLFADGRHVAANFNVRTLDVWRLKSGKVMVMTPSHFFLVKPGKPKEPVCIPWKRLSKFNIPKNKNVINIAFSKVKGEKGNPQPEKLEYKIEFKNNSDFVDNASLLIDTLQRVLTEGEQDKLFFKNLNAPAVIPTTKSGQARFRMNIQGKESQICDDTKDRMYEIIQSGIPNIDLSEFKDASVFTPMLFDCIPFIRTLRTVRVPQISDGNPYEIAANMCKEKSLLRALEINGKNSKNGLAKLVDAIKKNHASKIRGLSFGLAQLTSEDLDIISDLVAHCEVRTIGLHDALKDQNAVSYFYNSFLSPKVTQNLYCLNLEKSFNIDLDRLFPKISKVRFLSLANCDLDIVTVLKKLPLITMSRLRELNLSGNRVTCDQIIEPADEFPPYLLSLILNDISWPEDSFNIFLYQIFKHIPEKLKLSLSNSSMERNEWLKAFEFFDNPDKGGSYTGLSVFVWDNNPLHEKLFNFLKHNPNITRLQLNSCFMDDPTQTSAIDSLQDYLSTAAHLRTLIIRGSEEYYFGANTPRLIEAIKHIPNLEQFDIMNSRGGNDSIKPITELCLSLPKLKINFDGLHVTKFSALKSCLKQIAKSDKQRITYPSQDINRLIHSGEVQERDARHFQEIFYYNPEKTPLPKPPKNSRFHRIKDGELSKPSNLYRLNADDDFPRYISEELIEQFRKDNQPLSLTGEPEDPDHNKRLDDEVFYSMVFQSRRFSTRISPESLQSLNNTLNSKHSSSSSSSSEENVFNKNDQERQYKPTTFEARDVDIEEHSSHEDFEPKRKLKKELTSSSESDDEGPRTPRHIPESTRKSKKFSDEEESPRRPPKSPLARPGQIEKPNYDIPSSFDLKRYDYPDWKVFDKEYTLQKMYTEITSVKRSVALSSISPTHH